MSAWKADALPLGDSRVDVYSTVMMSDGQENTAGLMAWPKGNLLYNHGRDGKL